MTLRYLAQRIDSGAWLSLNLPLDSEGPDHTYSNYETMSFTISPEIGRRIAEDGRPVLERWGTWIHVETPDERVWTGIVDAVEGEDATLTVSAREWQGYLHELIFTGRIWGVNDDPADLTRELWEHTVARAGVPLNVQVVGATPRRIGSDSEDKMLAAKAVMQTAKAAWDLIAKPRKAKEAEIKRKNAPHAKAIKILDKECKVLVADYEAKAKAEDTASVIAAAKALVDAKRAQLKEARTARDAVIDPLTEQLDAMREAEIAPKAAYDAAKKTFDDAKTVMQKDGGAWKALAEDDPDSWRVLKDLAAEGPFDFTTHTKRTHGKPELTLRLHYPTAGRTRNDLVFEMGRNIVETPKVVEPDDYASEVIGSGAGEGSGDDEKVLRVMVAEKDSRLRRNAVVSDPAITKSAALRQIARAELRRRRVNLTIPEIVVRDHPNCRIGSWQAGDVITVRLHSIPHYGRVVLKCRIRSWQRVGMSKARLRLEPAHD